MSLQQLRYLLALDDLRHFSLAAKQCFVAQPTLTTQLKKLEEELGVQLIDRKASPLRPTPVGEKVIAQARIILEDVAGLEALLREETGSLAGTYVLGIIPTLAPYLLPLFLKSFTSRFPDVHLVIREMQSEEIMEGLKRGKVDLGLLVTPLEDKQLREIVLFYEPLQVYAAPTEPILANARLLPEHINQKELWVMEEGHCFRNQVLNICNFQTDGRHLNRAITFQAGSIETLKNMVRNNLGYTIVPEMSIHPTLDKGYVKSFADPQPAREVSLVVSKAFSREQLLVEFRKAVLAVIPDRFRKNERYVGVTWR